MLPQETVITTFGGRSVVVTNRRVRSYLDSMGESSMVSIFLEDVVSCSVLAVSKPWLLGAGVLLLVASLAIASKGGNVWITGVLVALAFVASYFFTIRRIVAISSAGASIRVDTAGTTESAAYDLITTIETAKDVRSRRRVPV
jgi:predicted anti-sigma-YlaC factor YlaD